MKLSKMVYVSNRKRKLFAKWLLGLVNGLHVFPCLCTHLQNETAQRTGTHRWSSISWQYYGEKTI